MGYYDEEDELDQDINSPEEKQLSLFDSIKKRFGKKETVAHDSDEADNIYSAYGEGESVSDHKPSVVKHARVETRNFTWWEILILLLEVFLVIYTILAFIYPELLF